MAKDDTRVLTPKLRFPEFRDGEAWTTEPMERLYSFMRNNALSRDKLNYQCGSVKNIHYGDIHTKFQTLFNITQESVPFINDTEPLPPFDSEDYCVERGLDLRRRVRRHDRRGQEHRDRASQRRALAFRPTHDPCSSK